MIVAGNPMVRRWLVAVALGLLLGLRVADAACAQDVAEADRTALLTTWRGQWEGGGYLFDAEMYLNMDGSNGLVGQIRWTLRRSPKDGDKSKVGLSGVEFIRGTFHPAARLLSLEGYEKDDPRSILGLDRYRLLLSENNQFVGGITWNHGSWNGRLHLSR